MKKKILTTVLTVATMAMLNTGCSNRQIFDTTYSFDYAIIQLPNGEIVEGEVKSWLDYDGEQLQVTFENGKTYLTSSLRCDLIKNK